MTFIINAQELKMKDKIVCDERIQIWLSKPYDESSLIIPQFGQTVRVRAAAAASATEVTVLPLVENLPQGATLTFTGETVTLTAPALAGDTTIQVNALTTGLAAFDSATTTGIEQTIVLANSVAVGDRLITVSAVSSWIEPNRILDFGNNIKLRTGYTTDEAATEIVLDEPAKYALAAGASADLPFYSRILSANTADDSSNANTLNERNFESGRGTAKAVTSYNDTIQISGNFIRYDEALLRMYELKENPALKGCLINCILGENYVGGRTVAGQVWLGANSNQRPNDQTKKIQVTLEVDGLLKGRKYDVVGGK